MIQRDLPTLSFMDRVMGDLDRTVEFIARFPWGRPEDRKKEISDMFLTIQKGPTLNEIGIRRRKTGVALRRQNVGQFVIVYAYFEPNAESPNGRVSIRAVRHSRVQHVFRGVREQPIPYGRHV